MLLKLYYRSFFNNTLHQVNANISKGRMAVKEAIEALVEDLDAAGELYRKPVLALLQGGRA